MKLILQRHDFSCSGGDHLEMKRIDVVDMQVHGKRGPTETELGADTVFWILVDSMSVVSPKLICARSLL